MLPMLPLQLPSWRPAFSIDRLFYPQRLKRATKETRRASHRTVWLMIRSGGSSQTLITSINCRRKSKNEGDKSMCRIGRHGQIGASIAATLMLATTQLLAQEAHAAAVTFNIESQPLARALNIYRPSRFP